MKTKKLLMSLTGILAFVLIASIQSANAQIWSEEFNGTVIGANNWTFETGAGGWGNNELEYYRSQNATVGGGIMTITAKRESFGGAAYTSTRMKTQGKRSWTYGRMVARARVPMGQGLWPAIWMLGNNITSVGWPACGEIDIMEHINAQATIYGTIHWQGPTGYANYGGSRNTTPANWHDYQINWNNLGIKWYIDGVQYHAANTANNINSTEEFHRPFFFILNLAVGGNWPGAPNSSTPFPAQFQVDYVRVYTANPGAARIGQTESDEIVLEEPSDEDVTISASPNPITNTLNYTVPKKYTNHTFKMFDLTGKEYISKEVTSESQHHSVEVGFLPSGTYVMSIHSGGFKKSLRVNKQ